MKMPRSFERWAGLALLLTVTWAAQAQEPVTPIRFQLHLTSAPRGGLHVGRIPKLEAVSVPESLFIPEDAAAQLTESIGATLSSREDGSRFEVLYTPSGRLRLVARTEPREHNSPLVAPFFEQLRQCFHSLPDNQEMDALYLILYGVTTEDPQRTQTLARAAAERMVEHLDSTDACTTHRNSTPISGETEARFRNAVQGMLTEEFDPRYFGSTGIVAVSEVLHPFLFGSRGLWVRERQVHLRDILSEAMHVGLLTEAGLSQLTQTRYKSFLDWMTHIVRQQPGISSEFIAALGELCLAGRTASLFKPFRLQDCLERGRIRLLQVKIGDDTYILVTRGEAP